MKRTGIRCKGIKKSYGSHENRVDALKNIDLDIYQNQLTLLVGPSGSGKSTLLSIITTILTPDEGRLFLLDREVTQMSDKEKTRFCRDSLGIVFQSLCLIPSLTVLENVGLPLVVAGVSQEVANTKAMIVLEKMNMHHRFNSPPNLLSKGQQQRVAIARAIINDAQIIVCDEPTSALDQKSGYDVMVILKEFAKHPNHTVLVVTHDNRIFSYADRIINISDGQIISGSDHE